MTALSAHPEMYAGLDGPSDDDRQWFHENPGAVVRLRPLLPDELEVHTSVVLVAGGADLPAININGSDGPLPLTHSVVVDLLRLAGKPCGPDGESARMRLCCPDPTSDEMRGAITRAALALGQLVAPRKPKRRGGLGFG